ncbi:putative protein kinase [Leptomonas pyrrhocoris]|uniref:Protein kinase domain-containing protein n=1 Tax=Leptomonas pyrrhocoris TaxID=157538 RepID=A0A0M9FRT5_LEPPY|nr:putative protein kinase [Leptomonas pyrrhocoris]KPA74713.1 putative protein kinase [Leptomonas pyrrhocoris]|eukprot:XP_015653152.1 putative protein kinase [Leptomonas pyrrhocoris]
MIRRLAVALASQTTAAAAAASAVRAKSDAVIHAKRDGTRPLSLSASAAAAAPHLIAFDVLLVVVSVVSTLLVVTVVLLLVVICLLRRVAAVRNVTPLAYEDEDDSGENEEQDADADVNNSVGVALHVRDRLDERQPLLQPRPANTPRPPQRHRQQRRGAPSAGLLEALRIVLGVTALHHQDSDSLVEDGDWRRSRRAQQSRRRHDGDGGQQQRQQGRRGEGEASGGTACSAHQPSPANGSPALREAGVEPSASASPSAAAAAAAAGGHNNTVNSHNVESTQGDRGVRSSAAGANDGEQATPFHATTQKDLVVFNTTHDSRYRLLQRIGTGAFSSVYLVQHKTTGQKYALKYILCKDDRERLAAMRECEVIYSLQGHPQVIRIVDMFMNYQFQRGGDGPSNAAAFLPPPVTVAAAAASSSSLARSPAQHLRAATPARAATTNSHPHQSLPWQVTSTGTTNVAAGLPHAATSSLTQSPSLWARPAVTPTLPPLLVGSQQQLQQQQPSLSVTTTTSSQLCFSAAAAAKAPSAPTTAATRTRWVGVQRQGQTADPVMWNGAKASTLTEAAVVAALRARMHNAGRGAVDNGHTTANSDDDDDSAEEVGRGDNDGDDHLHHSDVDSESAPLILSAADTERLLMDARRQQQQQQRRRQRAQQHHHRQRHNDRSSNTNKTQALATATTDGAAVHDVGGARFMSLSSLPPPQQHHPNQQQPYLSVQYTSRSSSTSHLGRPSDSPVYGGPCALPSPTATTSSSATRGSLPKAGPPHRCNSQTYGGAAAGDASRSGHGYTHALRPSQPFTDRADGEGSSHSSRRGSVSSSDQCPPRPPPPQQQQQRQPAYRYNYSGLNVGRGTTAAHDVPLKEGTDGSFMATDTVMATATITYNSAFQNSVDAERARAQGNGHNDGACAPVASDHATKELAEQHSQEHDRRSDTSGSSSGTEEEPMQPIRRILVPPPSYTRPPPGLAVVVAHEESSQMDQKSDRTASPFEQQQQQPSSSPTAYVARNRYANFTVSTRGVLASERKPDVTAPTGPAAAAEEPLSTAEAAAVNALTRDTSTGTAARVSHYVNPYLERARGGEVVPPPRTSYAPGGGVRYNCLVIPPTNAPAQPPTVSLPQRSGPVMRAWGGDSDGSSPSAAIAAAPPFASVRNTYAPLRYGNLVQPASTPTPKVDASYAGGEASTSPSPTPPLPQQQQQGEGKDSATSPLPSAAKPVKVMYGRLSVSAAIRHARAGQQGEQMHCNDGKPHVHVPTPRPAREGGDVDSLVPSPPLTKPNELNCTYVVCGHNGDHKTNNSDEEEEGEMQPGRDDRRHGHVDASAARHNSYNSIFTANVNGDVTAFADAPSPQKPLYTNLGVTLADATPAPNTAPPHHHTTTTARAPITATSHGYTDSTTATSRMFRGTSAAAPSYGATGVPEKSSHSTYDSSHVPREQTYAPMVRYANAGNPTLWCAFGQPGGVAAIGPASVAAARASAEVVKDAQNTATHDGNAGADTAAAAAAAAGHHKNDGDADDDDDSSNAAGTGSTTQSNSSGGVSQDIRDTGYLCLVVEYHPMGDLCHYVLRAKRQLALQQDQQQQPNCMVRNCVSQGGFDARAAASPNTPTPSDHSSVLPAGGASYNDLTSSAVALGNSAASWMAAAAAATWRVKPATSRSDPNLAMAAAAAKEGGGGTQNGEDQRESADKPDPTSRNPLTEPQLLSIAYQLSSVLDHMHHQSPPIIHRDLKPENVLIKGALEEFLGDVPADVVMGFTRRGSGPHGSKPASPLSPAAAATSISGAHYNSNASNSNGAGTGRTSRHGGAPTTAPSPIIPSSRGGPASVTALTSPPPIRITRAVVPIVVTDFGLAMVQEARTGPGGGRGGSRGGGTRPYIAPECWQGATCTASDMWSLGCVLYALATGRLTARTVRLMSEEAKRDGFASRMLNDIISEKYSLAFASFVVSLLVVDAAKRPTAAQAAQCFLVADDEVRFDAASPFFSNVLDL